MRLFVITVLLSFTVEAQVIGACGPGKNCRARTFTATSPSNGTIALQVPNLDFVYWGASCGIRANGSNLTASSACNFSFGNGQQGLAGGGLYFANVASMTTATTPSTLIGAATLLGETNTGNLYLSDGVDWLEVGDNHKGARWRTYVIESDRTAGANAPVWNPGPRAGGATPAFTSAGTLSNRTGPYSEALTNYQTTAVSGNQAHHSSTAFHAPGSYVSFRVGVPTLTSVRNFFGMSNTLPLTAGSSTPTAHAAVFRFDTSAGDTAWQACTGAGVAITCTTTGVTVTSTPDLDTTLEIDCREASALGIPTACTFWVNGIARVRVTTNMPAASVGNTASTETLTAAVRSLNFGARTIEAK